MNLVIWSPIIAYFSLQNLTQQQQVQKLAGFFHPSPFEALQVSDQEIANNLSKDLMDARGFIRVVPPKGACLRIKKKRIVKEYLICKTKLLSYDLHSLSESGKLVWRVYYGNSEFSTDVTWKSSYRFAQIIPAGGIGKEMGIYVPIKSCTASKGSDKDKIIIGMFDGKDITIEFPKKNKTLWEIRMEREEKKRIEIARQLELRKKGIKEDPEASSAGSDKKVSLADLISSRITKIKKVSVYDWVIMNENAREMNSSNLYRLKIPGETIGKCRYLFKNSPYDKKEGVIECTHTGDYDAILINLSCSSLFANP